MLRSVAPHFNALSNDVDFQPINSLQRGRKASAEHGARSHTAQCVVVDPRHLIEQGVEHDMSGFNISVQLYCPARFRHGPNVGKLVGQDILDPPLFQHTLEAEIVG